jgi:HemK-related putative methylase
MQAKASGLVSLALPRSIYRAALRLYVRFFLRGRKALRIENAGGIQVIVLPGVFNGVLLRTGAFLATTFDANLIPRGARVLDLGTGSGINALFAARLGARVVATDLNPEAVRCARINALAHHLEPLIETLVGDLFEAVGEEKFDVILFNPPYYRGRPRDLADLAWRSPDTFDRFMGELCLHLSDGGRALVVLSSDGDIQDALLSAKGVKVRVARQHDFINEILTVYEISCAEDKL